MTRIISVLLLTCMLGWFGPAAAEQMAEKTNIVVYRSQSCGCCGKWLKHLEDNNFNVIDHILDDVAIIKAEHGVPKELASCHTAIVDGYLVEGHVPAADIKAMLKDKPRIAGIAVPGMPSGTPGMEMGGRKDPYDVVAFDKENRVQVFNRYGHEQ